MKKGAPFLVLAGFLYMWLMVGFVTGTLTLLGPVRWLTARFREAGWPGESAAVIALIALLVLGSLLLTRWLFRRTLRAERPGLRLGIPAVVTAAALSTTWAWMNPGTIIGADRGVTDTVALADGTTFVFGPYPDEHRLEELHRAGFTGVVSLLHPAVVPFEPKLLAEERRAVKGAGLRFVHAPMLPWVGDNEASLDRVRRLATAGEGKYYVHCYLGRDRANAVRRLVEAQGGVTAGDERLAEARTLAERDEPFERGPVELLADGVWLLPFPNDHELFGYVLFGSTGHVVSLLDPENPQEAQWQDHMTGLLDEYAVSHTSSPLRAGDESRARAIAADVLAKPRPVLVVVPYTGPSGNPAVAETFREAFLSAVLRTLGPRQEARPRLSERQASARTEVPPPTRSVAARATGAS